MSQIFTVVGDSNIRNHVNKNSIRANPSLKAAQVLSCGNFSIFPATLEKVRSTSNVVIVACVSNFLSDAQGPPTVSLRVDPVLQDFRSALHEVCSALRDVRDREHVGVLSGLRVGTTRRHSGSSRCPSSSGHPSYFKVSV